MPRNKAPPVSYINQVKYSCNEVLSSSDITVSATALKASRNAIKYYNASTFLIAFLIKVGILSAGGYYLAPFTFLISRHCNADVPFSVARQRMQISGNAGSR